MKKVIFGFILMASITGCKKYDDDYLNSRLDKTTAYFASFQEYTRTLVVGEGLQFKIGVAMSGLLQNTQDRTVEVEIGRQLNAPSPRVLLPLNYFNSAELGAKTPLTIPKGSFIGYFTVKLDSTLFVNDPISMHKNLNVLEGYTLPVKIVSTSLDSIAKGLDSIKVSVKYIAGVDGWYLFKNTIRKQLVSNGSYVDAATQRDSSLTEADASTWRLLTQGPFKVRADAASSGFTNGFKFNLNVDQNKVVSYEILTGQTAITPEGTNTYDSKTRDFVLNYRVMKTGVSDTIYHVTSNLIFRNRVRDRVNETRDYLSNLNL